MTGVTDALLEAHVRHELDRLTGDGLDANIRNGVAALFVWLDDVSVNDVLNREQIRDVIEHYVIDLKVSGGITELAGEMSNVVFSSASAKQTRVSELLSDESYADFADKIGELDGVQRKIVGYFTGTAAFRTLASRLILHNTAEIFFQAGRSGETSWKTRFAASMRARFPEIQHQLGTIISRFGDVLAERIAVDANRRFLEVLDVEWLRLLADEVWDDISRRPVADAGQIISERDLEDFVVLGYEVWSKFRRTDYFRAVSFEVVDRLFEKYGEESLRAVIQDMGVTEQMIAHELTALSRPFFDEAHRSGFLESQIRARLEPFYGSPAVLDILGQSDPIPHSNI